MAQTEKPFEAPAKRWWTPDTVAVVTGGQRQPSETVLLLGSGEPHGSSTAGNVLTQSVQ